MPCILNIETSTQVCSVALSLDGAVIFGKCSFDGPSHAALLGNYVQEGLRVATEKNVKIDAVAVSSGPGSYTGLRIGVSVAKGVCFGADLPLIAVPTLRIMAFAALRQMGDREALYASMIDARRMEVYAAIYDANLQEVRQTAADIVTAETYAAFLEHEKVYFYGNGAAKCKDVIVSPHARFVPDIHPLATDMVVLSETAYEDGTFENVAYYEPFYLKDFVATVSKNKVLL